MIGDELLRGGALCFDLELQDIYVFLHARNGDVLRAIDASIGHPQPRRSRFSVTKIILHLHSQEIHQDHAATVEARTRQETRKAASMK